MVCCHLPPRWTRKIVKRAPLAEAKEPFHIPSMRLLRGSSARGRLGSSAHNAAKHARERIKARVLIVQDYSILCRTKSKKPETGNERRRRIPFELTCAFPLGKIVPDRMLAGHMGAAMALSRGERRLNLGMFVFAALLLDILFWALVLLGWESVDVPSDYAVCRQLTFEFPFSHGLLASVGWSCLGGVVVLFAMKGTKQQCIRAAMFISAAVFSHWLLDALVHGPELPISGAFSTKVGLSLWDHLTIALVLEAVIALVGLCIYLLGSGISRPRRIASVVLSVFVVLMTMAGMTVAPAPPSSAQLAGSSLFAILVMVLLFSWIDSGRNSTGITGK